MTFLVSILALDVRTDVLGPLEEKDDEPADSKDVKPADSPKKTEKNEVIHVFFPRFS